MEYETDQQGYEDDRGYANDRDRSRSPRPEPRGNGDARMRSASPSAHDRMDRSGPPVQPPEEDEELARNTGSNLFVTGIHPRLSEQEVVRIFEKYGEIEKCNIMRDPRTGESRGFGFVSMMTSAQADAAKEGLQGENIEGRTLSLEKARRSKPRTPTPGKYFGPPKRDDFRRPPPRGGRYEDRYDDRRGGYGGGYGGGRRDDAYGGYRDRGYEGRRYDDRGGSGSGSGRRERDDRPSIDRYASGGREDRYGSRGDSRRGGSDNYERGPPRGSAPAGDAAGYAEPVGARDYGGGSGSRSYEERAPAGEDRYARR